MPVGVVHGRRDQTHRVVDVELGFAVQVDALAKTRHHLADELAQLGRQVRPATPAMSENSLRPTGVKRSTRYPTSRQSSTTRPSSSRSRTTGSAGSRRSHASRSSSLSQITYMRPTGGRTDTPDRRGQPYVPAPSGRRDGLEDHHLVADHRRRRAHRTELGGNPVELRPRDRPDGEAALRRAPGGDQRRPEPVRLGDRVSGEVAGDDQLGEDSQARGLADGERTRQFGQTEALFFSGDQEVEDLDHPLRRWDRRPLDSDSAMPEVIDHSLKHVLSSDSSHVSTTQVHICTTGSKEQGVLTDPLAEAIAEAEKLVESAPQSGPNRICSRACSTSPAESSRPCMRHGPPRRPIRASSRAPARSRRWGWTTPTLCTSVPASTTTPSTSSPAPAAPPRT